MPEQPPPITTIFFDIGSVLLEVDVQGGLAEISGITGLAVDWLDQQLGGEALDALERGRITLRKYHAAIFKDTDDHTPLPYEHFERIWLGVLKAETPVTGLLPDLKKQVGVWYLSNSNHAHMDYVGEKYRFMAQADGVISSHEVGHRKPEREIYRLALHRAGAEAEQCLFVDDKPENVAAAQELGISAHQYTGMPGLVAFLGEHGLKVPSTHTVR